MSLKLTALERRGPSPAVGSHHVGRREAKKGEWAGAGGPEAEQQDKWGADGSASFSPVSGLAQPRRDLRGGAEQGEGG